MASALIFNQASHHYGEMQQRNSKTGETYFTKLRRRYDGDRAPRELTFSCFHRYPFLSKDRTRKWFIEDLNQIRLHWPIDLWAFVIMPEHVHLLVAPREPIVAVGRFVGAVKEKVARKAIGWLKKHSPEWIEKITVREGKKLRRRFWQPGGGYDRKVENLITLQAMIDYTHANPIRRNLVDRSEDWEWSSARWYLGIQTVSIEMDRTLPMFYE